MNSQSAQKHGPIRVLEDDRHFLVEIHPKDRNRAKMILGRQWDGRRIAWVYEKTPSAYDALVAEFRGDADVFDIRRPKSKTAPRVGQAGSDGGEEEVDWSALEDIGEGQTRLQDELVDVRNLLGALGESLATQGRVLDLISDSQREIANRIETNSDLAELPQDPEVVEVLPTYLDGSKDGHLRLLEDSLKRMAYLSSGQSSSLEEWLSERRPLREPFKFVTETSEYLKVQLEKIVDDADHRDSFYNLIERASGQIYVEEQDPIKVFPILRTINAIRNRFAHARDFDTYEQWNRSTTYLMNLALIWDRIMMSQDSND